MKASRSDLAARAKALAAGPSEAATPELRNSGTPQLRNSATPQLRTKPVRVTVELQPLEHQSLADWRRHYALALGEADVAGAEIFRALLAELNGGGELAARVERRIVESGGSRRR